MDLEATCDIYSDLGQTDLGDNLLSKEIERLEIKNNLLEEHILSLESDIGRLCANITEMKTVQNNLATNISELFKTAKAEIARKDRIISELRNELEKSRVKETPHNRAKDNRSGFTRPENDMDKKHARPYDAPRKHSYHIQKRSRSRSGSRERHKRPSKEEYSDSSKKPRYINNPHGTKTAVKREPTSLREVSQKSVENKDGNKSGRDQSKSARGVNEKVKSRKSEEKESTKKFSNVKDSRETEKNKVVAHKTVPGRDLTQIKESKENKEQKEKEVQSKQGLDTQNILCEEKSKSKLNEKKETKKDNVNKNEPKSSEDKTESKLDEKKAMKKENTNKNETESSQERTECKLNEKKTMKKENTDKNEVQSNEEKSENKLNEKKAMTKENTNKNEQNVPISSSIVSKVIKRKSLEQITNAMKKGLKAKENDEPEESEPSSELNKPTNRNLVIFDMFKKDEGKDTADQDKKIISSGKKTSKERKSVVKITKSKDNEKQTIQQNVDSFETSKDEESNVNIEPEKSKGAPGKGESKNQPQDKIEAPTMVLRSATRRKSFRETPDTITPEKKTKPVKKVNTPVQQRKCEISSVNLTHDGEIPVLHLSDESDKTNNLSVENIIPVTTSSPICVAVALKQLAEDLSMSSASNVGDTPEKDQHPKGENLNSGFPDTPVTNTPTQPKIGCMSSARKRRKVILTMID